MDYLRKNNTFPLVFGPFVLIVILFQMWYSLSFIGIEQLDAVISLACVLPSYRFVTFLQMHLWCLILTHLVSNTKNSVLLDITVGPVRCSDIITYIFNSFYCTFCHHKTKQKKSKANMTFGSRRYEPSGLHQLPVPILTSDPGA